MKEILHEGLDVLSNSILITGLVLIMMLMIEYFNVYTHGQWFSKLKGSKFKQIIVSTCLGMIPGCIGGFATVSLYTHKMISFGALVAMMIASSGDEAFIILAMIPDKALLLFGLLFVIAILSGVTVDYIFKKKNQPAHFCPEEIEFHSHNEECETPSIFKASSYKPMKRPSAKRLIILIGIALFITAVIIGIFRCSHCEDAGSILQTNGIMEHTCNHGHSCTHNESNTNAVSFNILDEQWINIIFAIISIVTLFFTATAKEHFINDHIWQHIVKRHALSIFLWTFGALLICQIGIQFLDVSKWVSDNMFIVMLLAVLIGIIPESGPHIIFITLFAQGIIPFYILFVNSIVQDGHTTIPLLAHNKIDFLTAKVINIVIGFAVGCCCYIFL